MSKKVQPGEYLVSYLWATKIGVGYGDTMFTVSKKCTTEEFLEQIREDINANAKDSELKPTSEPTIIAISKLT